MPKIGGKRRREGPTLVTECVLHGTEEAAAFSVLTFRIDEALPGGRVRGGELLLDFGNVFRMQVVKQTLANQIILSG